MSQSETIKNLQTQIEQVKGYLPKINAERRQLHMSVKNGTTADELPVRYWELTNIRKRGESIIERNTRRIKEIINNKMQPMALWA